MPGRKQNAAMGAVSSRPRPAPARNIVPSLGRPAMDTSNLVVGLAVVYGCLVVTFEAEDEQVEHVSVPVKIPDLLAESPAAVGALGTGRGKEGSHDECACPVMRF